MKMEQEVKMDLVKVCEMASPTLAMKLGISTEAGWVIMRLIDNLPEIRAYYKTMDEIPQKAGSAVNKK